MLEETLDLPQEAILESIRSLKQLTDPAQIGLILDTAAEGEGSQVREALSKYLDDELMPLLPEFMELVGALVEAVGAGAANEGSALDDSQDDSGSDGGFMTDSSDD